MKGINKPKISYDKESRVLSLEFKKAKSVDSDVRGNIIIDYNEKGQIVRIDVYDFSFDDFIDDTSGLKHSLKNFGIPFAIK